MKWPLFYYSILTFALLGCQQLTPAPEVRIREYPVQMTSDLEQTVKYGAVFASEYRQGAKETCAKYKQRYQQGDWRAGWVLALQLDETGVNPCLNIDEATLILTSLEAEQRVNSDLLWLNQYYLWRLYQQQQQTKKIRQLKFSIKRYRKQVSDLKEENESQLKKLEALKAIETSIINND